MSFYPYNISQVCKKSILIRSVVELNFIGLAIDFGQLYAKTLGLFLRQKRKQNKRHRSACCSSSNLFLKRVCIPVNKWFNSRCRVTRLQSSLINLRVSFVYKMYISESFKFYFSAVCTWSVQSNYNCSSFYIIMRCLFYVCSI